MDSTLAPYLINRPSYPLAFVACIKSKDFITELATVAALIITTEVIVAIMTAIRLAAVIATFMVVKEVSENLPPFGRVRCSSLN
jgi:hypothetical protein